MEVVPHYTLLTLLTLFTLFMLFKLLCTLRPGQGIAGRASLVRTLLEWADGRLRKMLKWTARMVWTVMTTRAPAVPKKSLFTMFSN